MLGVRSQEEAFVTYGDMALRHCDLEGRLWGTFWIGSANGCGVDGHESCLPIMNLEVKVDLMVEEVEH